MLTERGEVRELVSLPWEEDVSFYCPKIWKKNSESMEEQITTTKFLAFEIVVVILIQIAFGT